MPKNKESSIRMKLKDQASKQLKGVQAGFRRFGTSIKQMGAAFLKIGIALAAVAAAAVLALKQIISTGMTYALQLDKMAKMTGIAADELARLTYAAQQEHASMEALEKGLMNLTVRIGYAGDGLATYLRYFTALGIEYKKADGTLRNTYDVFLDIADVTSKGKLTTEKLAAVMQLFGARAAKELIPMLKKGRSWFDEMGKSAEQLGIVLDSKTTGAMKKLDDEVTRAKTAWKGVQTQLTIFLIPALREVTELITEDIKAVVVWSSKLKENKEVIAKIKDALVEGYKAAQEFVISLIIGAAQVIDAWNEVAVLITMIRIGWAKLWESTKEEAKYLEELQKILDKMVANAEVDFSVKMVNAINKFKQALTDAKKEIVEVKAAFRDPFEIPQEVLDKMNELTDPASTQNARQAWLDLGDGIRAGIEKAHIAFGSFKDRITKHTVSMINNMKTMWSDFVYNVFIGQLDDAKKAFESFGKSVLRIISNIISEWIAMQIITGIGKMFGGGVGGGATPGMDSAIADAAGASGFGGFHQGGMIRAHRGMYLAPDEVPIIAQTGERVLNREDTVDLDRLLKRQDSGESGNTYHFNMTIVTNDEKSFRDRLLQNEDVYVNAGANSIERNGLLRGVINKYTKK